MKVSVLLTEKFETVEAMAVIDLLRRACVDVETVSISDLKMVTSAQGISVMADFIFDEADFESTDVLFLPGGPGHTLYMESPGVLELVKAHYAKNKRIAAICAAPVVLGELGLLEGKKAICFPGCEDKLHGAILQKAPVKTVTDGNITTSRGMGTAMDMGFELVSLLCGRDVADELWKTTQCD